MAAAVSLAGCDLGEFAFGVGRALTEGEHYAVKDGQVVWVSHPSMGTTPRRVERRVEADPATFRIAAHEMYATDARAVFCKGRPLAGGDPRGFRLIPGAPDDRTPAATDGATVWLGCDEIAGADGAGFRFLQGPYATDGRSVFRATSRIDGAQPASFRILDLKNDVAVDAGAAYSGIFRIPTDTPAAIRSLGGGYTTDGRTVFWRQFVAEGADPATFRVGDGEMFGRDTSGCWTGARPQPCLKR